jgi:hypothetical protein
MVFVCFLLGHHSIFRLSRFIILPIDWCGMFFTLWSPVGLLSVDVFFDIFFFSYYGFFVSSLVPLSYSFRLFFLVVWYAVVIIVMGFISRNPWKPPVRIAVFLAKIWTGHLHSSQECCSYAVLLGHFVLFSMVLYTLCFLFLYSMTVLHVINDTLRPAFDIYQ